MVQEKGKGGVLAIIPSRLASTRLPEKPLKEIAGKSLVQRVWEQAKKAQRLDRVAVATDAQPIFDHVKSFGGEVIMTSPELATGSERVFAAAGLLSPTGQADHWSLILNVQGDMPLLPPEAIDRLVTFLQENLARFSMATIATPIEEEEMFLSPTVVKVVISSRNEGLYFSRAPIPFPREATEKCSIVSPDSGRSVYGFKHLGLYAFTPQALESYRSADISSLERVERLEQLRVLEKGERIGVLVVEESLMRNSVEVDTAADLERASVNARGN